LRRHRVTWSPVSLAGELLDEEVVEIGGKRGRLKARG
jgi:hypothetical protein